jgi:hypothetical protein
MANEGYDDWELELYRENAEEIKKNFKPNEITVMVKIYRWTKSERNAYFFTYICKREYNYKKALRKLRSLSLIWVVRGNDPHKITKDGMRTGRLMLLCQDLGFI